MTDTIKSITSSFDDAKKQPQISSVAYSDEEAAYRGFIIQRLMEARDQREMPHLEFNDQSYSEYYDSNAKAANSYNPPKVNKDDSRIVTGTTTEKEAALLAALLNYNLEPNVVAYNKQQIKLREIGGVMEDLVKKSREMEHYLEKRPLVYKELLDQGTVFVEEIRTEYISVEKTLKPGWKMGGVDSSKIKWERKLKKAYAECEINILEGKKVYLGNVREFFIDKQPFIFTHDIVPYSVARAMFGDWDRFVHVPKTIVRFDAALLEESEYRDWSLLEIQPGFVEILKYQDRWDNDFQIILNGVMMLPAGFPLSAVSPSGNYTIAKGDLEPISKFFAYSRAIPAKTKVDQGIFDEMFRVLMLKFRQGAEPPLANKGNRVLSRKVFAPGSITNGLNPDDISVIGVHNGVGKAEFDMFDLMKSIIDSKSVSATFSGEMTQPGTTATEIQEVKKNQMMKMGTAMLGAISLERQLCSLRLPNILITWSEAIDERVDDTLKEIRDVYRIVSMDTTFEDGQKGERVVSFDTNEQSVRTSEEIDAMEQYMKKKHGRNMRFNFINAEDIKKIVTHWYINIIPTERDSTELDRVLFVQNIMQAAEIFGPQSLNMEYIKERFASLIGEDENKFFIDAQAAQPGAEPGSPPPELGTGDIAAEMLQKGGVATPSLNTLQQA